MVKVFKLPMEKRTEKKAHKQVEKAFCELDALTIALLEKNKRTLERIQYR